jgi:hypothetical protein
MPATSQRRFVRQRWMPESDKIHFTIGSKKNIPTDIEKAIEEEEK